MNMLSPFPYPPALGTEGTGIRRAAVVGAGSMGAGIAAQFANAGIPVDLLDIPGEKSLRNGPAEDGIARQVKAGAFMAAESPRLIRPGNVEDDLGRLAEADWIIEAVVEDLDVKCDLYRRLGEVRRPGTIVSSNTSTIPRTALVEGQGEAFANDFIITHFFNPPRVMRLVELVTGAENSDALVKQAAAACEAILGKTVVMCRDTPGFIANRIGCYWMSVGILEAMRLGLTVEEADSVNAAFGVPRTGVFGLADLIGIDLVPHIWGSLMATLPGQDGIHAFDLPGSKLIRSMVADGRHGRKTSQGFYRKDRDGSRQTLDLANVTYRSEIPAEIPGGGRDLAALFSDKGKIGAYALSVMTHVVGYSAASGPEIALDVAAIDTAMMLGYSWRDGPFGTADRIGLDFLTEHMSRIGMAVSPLFKAAEDKGGFFAADGPLLTGGKRGPLVSATALSSAPIITGNAAARLRDLGDSVACFEITTKMNSFAPEVFDVLEETLTRAGSDYRALVLGNEDARAFSGGADLSFILGVMDAGDTDALAAFITRGQELFLAMKYSPVPVVAAAHGFALGGGCEFMLHADAIVAHAELNSGLPETKVGLIPAWGGCTQLLIRAIAGPAPNGPLAAAATAFETIRLGTVLTSALQARTTGILRTTDGIVMQRGQLLPAAKAKALSLIDNYAPPEPAAIAISGPAGRLGILAAVSAATKAGRLTETDRAIADQLALVLTGGAHGNPLRPISEAGMMSLERDAFLSLAEEPTTRARISYMLETGKPLQN